MAQKKSRAARNTQNSIHDMRQALLCHIDSQSQDSDFGPKQSSVIEIQGFEYLVTLVIGSIFKVTMQEMVYIIVHAIAIVKEIAGMSGPLV